jgi:hypothetical protein
VMRTWVSLTKLRLHHIMIQAPLRIVYFPGNTSELSLQSKFPSSRVHLGLDLPRFRDQGQNYSLIRVVAFILLPGIFWPQRKQIMLLNVLGENFTAIPPALVDSIILQSHPRVCPVRGHPCVQQFPFESQIG